ncbi:uncharacterized protein BJ171DRAFT_495025 [Polychytrium aggregatum]|uniref:uncharacterized protein n=1 Tax=Polychytrium aggregatum TaxID=110093 RepID=UPI0022FEF9A2|nr:uncharacterized protein BJ171DRAFT_495025 [Polychytrium aggregatum]KAI9206868.1 hypothetical protein BJ171DRAFT_495025 [Polychytrium aggregatum]
MVQEPSSPPPDLLAWLSDQLVQDPSLSPLLRNILLREASLIHASNATTPMDVDGLDPQEPPPPSGEETPGIQPVDTPWHSYPCSPGSMCCPSSPSLNYNSLLFRTHDSTIHNPLLKLIARVRLQHNTVQRDPASPPFVPSASPDGSDPMDIAFDGRGPSPASSTPSSLMSMEILGFQQAFPPDVLILIFQNLDVPTFLRCQQVCRHWYLLSHQLENAFWPHFVRRDFALSQPPEPYSTVKDYYISQQNLRTGKCQYYNVKQRSFALDGTAAEQLFLPLSGGDDQSSESNESIGSIIEDASSTPFQTPPQDLSPPSRPDSAFAESSPMTPAPELAQASRSYLFAWPLYPYYAYQVALDHNRLCWINSSTKRVYMEYLDSAPPPSNRPRPPKSVQVSSLSGQEQLMFEIRSCGNLMEFVGHTQAVALLLTNGEGLLYMFDDASYISIWDLDRLELLQLIDATTEDISSMNVYKRKLVIGGRHGRVTVRDADSGQIERVLTIPESYLADQVFGVQSQFMNVAIWEDKVVYGLYDQTYYLHDIKTGELLHTFRCDLVVPELRVPCLDDAQCESLYTQLTRKRLQPSGASAGRSSLAHQPSIDGAAESPDQDDALAISEEQMLDSVFEPNPLAEQPMADQVTTEQVMTEQVMTENTGAEPEASALASTAPTQPLVADAPALEADCTCQFCSQQLEYWESRSWPALAVAIRSLPENLFTKTKVSLAALDQKILECMQEGLDFDDIEADIENTKKIILSGQHMFSYLYWRLSRIEDLGQYIAQCPQPLSTPSRPVLQPCVTWIEETKSRILSILTVLKAYNLCIDVAHKNLELTGGGSHLRGPMTLVMNSHVILTNGILFEEFFVWDSRTGQQLFKMCDSDGGDHPPYALSELHFMELNRDNTMAFGSTASPEHEEADGESEVGSLVCLDFRAGSRRGNRRVERRVTSFVPGDGHRHQIEYFLCLGEPA